MGDKQVYIGNLPADVRKEEIKDAFAKFGDIIDVRVKCPPNGTSSFAFVEYSNAEHGIPAIDEFHDKDFLGRRLKVEFTKPKRRFEDRPRYDDRGGRGGDRYGGRDYGRDRDGGRDYGRDRDGGRDHGRDRDGGRDRDYGRDRDGGRDYGRDRDGGRDYGRDRDGGRDRDYGRDRRDDRRDYGRDRYDDRRGDYRRDDRRAPRRGQSDNPFAIEINGLPRGFNWMDLKDLVRKNAGEVSYVEVRDDGTGVAKFKYKDDMEKAVSSMHDMEVEGERITVKEAEQGGASSSYRDEPRRDRSRSRSRDADRRERSRSPPRKDGDAANERSVSRGRSPSNQ